MEDRWAYMIGILTPAGWLFATGITGCRRSVVAEAGTWPRTYEFSELPGRRDDGAERLEDCGLRPALAQRVGGPGKPLTTLVVSLYYGILVLRFWHMIPITAAHTELQPFFLALSANRGPSEFFLRPLTLAVLDAAQEPTKSLVFVDRY